MWLSTVDVDPNNLAREVFFQVSPLSITLLSPFHSVVFLRKSPFWTQGMKRWGYSIYIRLLEFFFIENVSVFLHLIIYSIIYSNHYGFIYLFYILDFTPILFYFVAQKFQIWALGGLSGGPVSLWHTPITVLLS